MGKTSSKFILLIVIALIGIGYLSYLVSLELSGEKEFKEGFEYSKLTEKFDMNKANALYLKSAEKGYAIAQFSLGLSYRLGRGFEKNDEEAFKWFSLAAEQGHEQSLYWVGMHLKEGRGVEKNEEKAQKYFKLAYLNSKKDFFKDYLKSLINE